MWINLFKVIFRRIACRKHLYKFETKVFYEHRQYDYEEIVLSRSYICSKCGKVLKIKMDEQYQVDNAERRW